MTIVAAADGSSLGNPGPAGWAWYIDEGNWQAGGWPSGTNNQGELTAVLELLRAVPATEPLQIICDSQYVINALTKWRFGWKQRGWKKADKKPVENLELMQALDRQLQDREVKFKWVRGHTGHPLNEAADTRARAVAQAFQDGEPAEAGPGFSGRATDCEKTRMPSCEVTEDESSELTQRVSTQESAGLEENLPRVKELIELGIRPGTAVEIVARWFGVDTYELQEYCRLKITLH